MDAIFLKLLNMSLTASWLCLAVLILRLLLKRAPKAISCTLWALVGLRLLFPFSLESVLSLIPSAEPLPQDMLLSPTPTINSGIPALNSVVNPVIWDSLAPTSGDSVNPMQVITTVAGYVWVIGMIAMLVYMLASYLRVRGKVAEAAKIESNMYECDHINTPFILGVIRPRIYLPSSMNEADRAFVIAHEQAHLRRLDHLWKPLGFLLLTVYWFNPLLWLGYILLCRDIELACDEKVIRQLGTDVKKQYSEALINCSVPRRAISACPLAFGEVGVKGRIKSVLNYKKPAFWIILVAVVALVVTGVCFLTDPPTPTDNAPADIEYYEWVGEYNMDTFLKASNSYVQSGKKPVSYYNKSMPAYDHISPTMETASLTVSYPIQSCRVMGIAPATNHALTEYQEITARSIETHAEGCTAYIDLSWWEDEDNVDVSVIAVWSYIIELTDMENVKHYYYFRVDYTNWSFQSPGQSQTPLPYTAWNLTATREFTLSQFKGTKFVYSDAIYMVDREGKKTELISGMPVQKAVFADLNQDGYPEFLGQALFGSGFIHEFIVVYDIKNDQFYGLDERFAFDFDLVTGAYGLSITIKETSRRLGSVFSAIPVLVKNGDGSALELQNGGTVLYRSYADGRRESLLPEVSESYVFSPDNSWYNQSSVTLYENNQFCFFFSPTSSYLGIGTYEIKDGRLILSTDDGKYTYVFEMHEDKLIYLGTQSNGYTWMGQFADGSEFIKQNTN